MRDIDIRRALLECVREMHANEPSTRYLEELAICGGISRADVAVVNGSLHCYEIKSKHDTLARLPSQRAVYDRAFDYVTVVASEAHIERILTSELIPEWWGIMAARESEAQITLHVQREEKPNPEIEKVALAQFLWREEVICALEGLNLARGNRSKNKNLLWRILAEAMTVDELGAIVREVLKSRLNWKADKSLM